MKTATQTEQTPVELLAEAARLLQGIDGAPDISGMTPAMAFAVIDAARKSRAAARVAMLDVLDKLKEETDALYEAGFAVKDAQMAGNAAPFGE